MNYISPIKQMRLILIYDLPVQEEQERRAYSKFHNNIIRLGFHMLQYSVYSKVINNDTMYQQTIPKVEKILPEYGNIIIFKVTEKQYQNMIYLRGEQNKYDVIVGGKELIVFGGDS